MRTYRTELKTVEEQYVDTITCSQCRKVFDYDTEWHGVEVQVRASSYSRFGDYDDRKTTLDLCDDCYDLTDKFWRKE